MKKPVKRRALRVNAPARGSEFLLFLLQTRLTELHHLRWRIVLLGLTGHREQVKETFAAVGPSPSASTQQKREISVQAELLQWADLPSPPLPSIVVCCGAAQGRIVAVA